MSKKKPAIKWQIYTVADPTVERIIPSLAKEIGLNESIVLMQIAFWIKISNNQVNGAYWTYQSMADMQEKAFPYWSVDTIRRIVHKLHKQGYILIGQHNKRAGDNTQWYALEPDKLSTLKSIIVQPIEGENSTPSLQVASVPYSQVATPSLQDRTTLPEITTENTEKDSAPISAKDTSPQKSKTKQRPIFNAIAEHVFGLTDMSGVSGGRVTNLEKVAKRVIAARLGELTDEEIALEVTRFAKGEKFKPSIQGVNNFELHFAAYLDRVKAKVISLSAPPTDLSDWVSPDPFDFLKSEGA